MSTRAGTGKHQNRQSEGQSGGGGGGGTKLRKFNINFPICKKSCIWSTVLCHGWGNWRSVSGMSLKLIRRKLCSTIPPIKNIDDLPEVQEDIAMQH